MCYDKKCTSRSEGHFRQIISDILKPATSAINSNFLRKRVAQFAGQQWIANRNFGTNVITPYGSTYSYNWIQVASGLNGALEEIYIDTNCPNTQVFRLTPQMLQRRFTPLSQFGYFGKQPFRDMPPMIELVTDIETCWELDKLGGSTGTGGVPSITGNWRFEQWDSANKYWKYNYSGQLGEHVVRVDPLILAQLCRCQPGFHGGKRALPLSGRAALSERPVQRGKRGCAPASRTSRTRLGSTRNTSGLTSGIARRCNASFRMRPR